MKKSVTIRESTERRMLTKSRHARPLYPQRRKMAKENKTLRTLKCRAREKLRNPKPQHIP